MWYVEPCSCLFGSQRRPCRLESCQSMQLSCSGFTEERVLNSNATTAARHRGIAHKYLYKERRYSSFWSLIYTLHEGFCPTGHTQESPENRANVHCLTIECSTKGRGRQPLSAIVIMIKGARHQLLIICSFVGCRYWIEICREMAVPIESQLFQVRGAVGFHTPGFPRHSVMTTADMR